MYSTLLCNGGVGLSRCRPLAQTSLTDDLATVRFYCVLSLCWESPIEPWDFSTLKMFVTSYQTTVTDARRHCFFYLLYHGSGGQTSASHYGDPGSISDRCMCHLWWIKWHWDRFLSQYLGFPLSISFHQCAILCHRRCIVFEIFSVVKWNTKPARLPCARLDVFSLVKELRL
jgi:hypothetical protein